MLEPLAVDPNRSVAPAANSIASARLVFPAPAGPASAITRVPFDSPALLSTMCDSPFVPLRARESLSREALRRLPGNIHRPPVFPRWQEASLRCRRTSSWNAPAMTEVFAGMVDRKGHQATSPWQMPLAAWKDIAARTYKRTWDDNVG